MSAQAARRSRWPFVGPALAGAIALGLAAGVVGGVLSRTLVLDLLALWPLGAVAVVGMLVAWALRRRRPRLIAVPGLIVFTWLVLGLALHLSAADWLPSAASDVARESPVAEADARLEVELESGSLEVGSSDRPGYSVVPIRAGGAVGAPEVLEQVGDDRLSLVVIGREDSEWFRFRGWTISLDSTPQWDLDLRAGHLDADLSALTVGAAALAGRTGSVRLGPPAEGGSSLTVDGEVVVTVPATVPVEVVGEATAPAGWESTGSGGRAPVEGVGWSIEVLPDARVTIRAQ